MREYLIFNRSRQKKGSHIKRISLFIDSKNCIKTACIYTDYSTLSRDYSTPDSVKYVMNRPSVKNFIRTNNCRTLNYYRNGKLKYTCKYYAPGEYNIERNVNY